ncbi:MAG: phosphotransferase [Gordonia polyisoprenivorans]|nr:phosphotransferase [Gordonia polyisoprenivorans]
MTTPGRGAGVPAPVPGTTSTPADDRIDNTELAGVLQINTRAIDEVWAVPCGVGQLADSYRVHMTYRDGQPRSISVFVKLPPREQHSAATAQHIDAFARESYFYTSLSSRLDVRTPRFLGEITLPDGQAGLVLEDLTPITRPLDQLTDGTVEQAASAMGELAGLQAPLWDDVAAAGGIGHFYNRLDDLIEGLAERYQRSWHRFGGEIGAGLSTRQRRLIADFGNCCVTWASGVSGPRTLTHQDLRLDNLLWSESSGVTLVDWQTLAFTSPAWDPAFLLGTALEPDVRRSAERELLARHVDALAERGVRGWGFDRAWTEHRRLSGSVLLAMIAALAYVAPTSRGFDMFASLIARGAQQADDLGLADFCN